MLLLPLNCAEELLDPNLPQVSKRLPAHLAPTAAHLEHALTPVTLPSLLFPSIVVLLLPFEPDLRHLHLAHSRHQPADVPAPVRMVVGEDALGTRVGRSPRIHPIARAPVCEHALGPRVARSTSPRRWIERRDGPRRRLVVDSLERRR